MPLSTSADWPGFSRGRQTFSGPGPIVSGGWRVFAARRHVAGAGRQGNMVFLRWREMLMSGTGHASAPGVDSALRSRLERCSTLPTLPAVAIKVLDLCQRENLDLP